VRVLSWYTSSSYPEYISIYIVRFEELVGFLIEVDQILILYPGEIIGLPWPWDTDSRVVHF